MNLLTKYEILFGYGKNYINSLPNIIGTLRIITLQYESLYEVRDSLRLW